MRSNCIWRYFIMPRQRLIRIGQIWWINHLNLLSPPKKLSNLLKMNLVNLNANIAQLNMQKSGNSRNICIVNISICWIHGDIADKFQLLSPISIYSISTFTIYINKLIYILVRLVHAHSKVSNN